MHDAVTPWLSVAVHVTTVVVPSWKTDPEGGVQVVDTIGCVLFVTTGAS